MPHQPDYFFWRCVLIGGAVADTPAAAETVALGDCQRSGPGCRVALAECNR